DNPKPKPRLDNSTAKLRLDNSKPKPRLDNSQPKARLDNPKLKPRLDNQKPKPRLDNSQPKPRLDNSKLKPRLDNQKPTPRLDNPKSKPRLDNPNPKPRLDNPKSKPRLDNPNPKPRLDNPKPKPRPDKCDSCFPQSSYIYQNNDICSTLTPVQRNVKLLMLIFTLHNELAIRNTLRKTWTSISKQNTHNLRYVFLLGMHEDPKWNERALIEAKKHGDIMIKDFIDVYSN
ncbi:unnamed protein product, partial [Owenia fusiformis]